jgi:hypothetical protein
MLTIERAFPGVPRVVAPFAVRMSLLLPSATCGCAPWLPFPAPGRPGPAVAAAPDVIMSASE